MEFAKDLLAWYDLNARALPWRGERDPYRVWLSEIMLQQTRTVSAEGYYDRFLRRFPDVKALAEAPEEEVLKYWEGLGYYARARNLHRAAQEVVARYGGVFPADAALLRALPGVGPYTAAAVASIAFSLPEPAIDGNLIRVLCRTQGIRENAARPSVRRLLEDRARALIPLDRPGDFNQALMDLGASVCVPGTPDCAACPLCALCDAYQAGDADRLPVLPDKKPPREIPLNVLVIIRDGRVYMTARKEALLRGMYVYLLTQDAPSAALRRLRVQGKALPKGEAKHVFTHQVWRMKLWLCRAEKVPPALEPFFHTLSQMEALPVPTAMRAARSLALDALKGELPDETAGPQGR